MAAIHIYTGPMASGKTSKMLDTLHKYSNVTKERVLLINFEGDDRGKDPGHGVTTHSYGDSSAKIPLGIYVDTIRCTELLSISHKKLDSYTMIGIDEAQFFTDLKEFINRNKRNSKLMIYVSGLAYDSNNNPFGQISELLNVATTFEKMTAICSICDPRSMTPAGFTYASKSKESVISIGGLEMYKPLCFKHYLDLMK